MSKLSRTKGHSYEREIAIAFRKVGFKDAKRHLEYQACEAQGIDLDGTGKFKVQCKRGRGYAPINRIEEIQVDPIEGGIPVLVTRADNKESMAVLTLKDFLDLVSKARFFSSL